MPTDTNAVPTWETTESDEPTWEGTQPEEAVLAKTAIQVPQAVTGTVQNLFRLGAPGAEMARQQEAAARAADAETEAIGSSPFGVFRALKPAVPLAAAGARVIGKGWEATGIPQVGRDLASDFIRRTGIDPSSTPTPELGQVLNLPKITPEMVSGAPKAVQIGAGAFNVAPAIIEGFFQDPALAAATFGTGTLPRAARTLLGTQQFLALPQEVKNAVQVWSDPKSTTADKTQALIQPGVSAYFGREMLRHGWRPEPAELRSDLSRTGAQLPGRPVGAVPSGIPPIPTGPVPPRTAFPPGPAPTTPVPPREAFPPGPAPTTPVPPREAFPPGPAPAYPPAQQWAFRPDLPPGPAPREAVPPRPPEPPPAAAIPSPELPITTPGAPGAASKPEIAILEPDVPGKAKNTLGDPVGTTYHATPEDWAAWQALKRLPAKERVLNRSAEYEALRNKYGGADPQPPKGRPEVAKAGTAQRLNDFGDPHDTRYYATPEDWAKWQDLKGRLAKALADKDLDAFQKLGEENEALKNKYGGNPPLEPPAEPTKEVTEQMRAVADRPKQGTGATEGPGSLGEALAEAEMLKRAEAKLGIRPAEPIPPPAAEATEPATQPMTREQAERVVKEADARRKALTDWMRQSLAIQKKIFKGQTLTPDELDFAKRHIEGGEEGPEGNTYEQAQEYKKALRVLGISGELPLPKTQPAAEPTKPAEPTPPVAPPAAPEPEWMGKPVSFWEQVAAKLPTGDLRASLAKSLGVPNQPAKIIQHIKRRVAEIRARAAESVRPNVPSEQEKPIVEQAATGPSVPTEKPEGVRYVDKSNGNQVVITPSVKQPGKWQLTELIRKGESLTPFGDYTFDSLEQAKKAMEGKQIAPAKTGSYVEAETPAPTPEPKPAEAETPVKFVGTKKTAPWPQGLVSKSPTGEGWRFSWFTEFTGDPGVLEPKGHKDFPTRQAALDYAKELDFDEAETKSVAPETKPPVSETKPPVAATQPPPAATPAPSAKAQAEVSKVAATEGQRPAKKVKSELVGRIEDELAKLPEQKGDVEFSKPATYSGTKKIRVTPFGGGPWNGNLELTQRGNGNWNVIVSDTFVGAKTPVYRSQVLVDNLPLAEAKEYAREQMLSGNPFHMEKPVSEGERLPKQITVDWKKWPHEEHPARPAPETVTIDIPGDGTFTIPKTRYALNRMLARAKSLDTKPVGGEPFTESLPSRKEGREAAAEAAQPPPAEPPTPPPEAAGPQSIGPGAAASAEFTARENRRRLLADFTERLFGSRAGEAVDAFLRKMAGEAVPKTMSLSGESGNKMVRFAAANNAAPHIARSLTLEVLGDNFRNADFRERLGAVLVEDRLRAIRKGLEDAADREADLGKKQELLNQAHDVNSLVGPDKPFETEADFLNALDDPEISKAIDAHKQGPQVEAERFHTEADGQLAGPGVHTGAFVNLAPIFEDRPEMIFRGARKGDYTRPFKRKSVFSRTAKGTAAKYELDYGTLAERMIRGNYEEFTKRQLYDQLVADNLAVIRPPGQPAPKFDGRPADKFQIKRQTLITPNGAIPQYENLWVHPDVAPELRQAENLGSPVSSIALARVANVLNRIQLAGPTDAVWHIANMMSTIAGSQGGKTFLADLARKVPLVNVIDATVRVTQAAKKILANDPDVMRQISELAEIGQVRPERPGGGATSRIINLLDKAGRVVRDDMYKNLVNRGLVEASEAGRREFVGQLGQYNPRLMGQIESFFKEAGFSPFIVAGRNFNRAALRRLTLSPGVRAANLTSALQMRALEATGVVATLVAVPSIINMMTTGKPGGRDPSIPFGAIDTGKDDKNGKHIYIDPAQWIGLRRGMRLTGINAVIEGMRRGTPMRQIEKRAGQDIIGALVHPWAGPVVQLPFITATGYTTSGFKESKDPGDYWQNFKAALENINPVVHGWFQKQPGTGVAGGLESSATSLLSAIGVKTRAPATATSQVHDMAQTWASKSDDPKIRSEYEQHVKESFSSEYQDLRSALLRNDTAGARDAYRQLRDKGKKPATIRQTLQHPHPFTGSARAEARFRQSLTPEQREVYNKAIEERRQLYHKFQQMLATPNQ